MERGFFGRFDGAGLLSVLASSTETASLKLVKRQMYGRDNLDIFQVCVIGPG